MFSRFLIARTSQASWAKKKKQPANHSSYSVCSATRSTDLDDCWFSLFAIWWRCHQFQLLNFDCNRAIYSIVIAAHHIMCIITLFFFSFFLLVKLNIPATFVIVSIEFYLWASGSDEMKTIWNNPLLNPNEFKFWNPKLIFKPSTLFDVWTLSFWTETTIDAVFDSSEETYETLHCTIRPRQRQNRSVFIATLLVFFSSLVNYCGCCEYSTSIFGDGLCA